MHVSNKTTHILLVRHCEPLQRLTEEALGLIPNQPYFMTACDSLAEAGILLGNGISEIVLIDEDCIQAEEIEMLSRWSQDDASEEVHGAFIILVNQADALQESRFAPPGQERFHYLLKSEISPRLLDFTIREVLHLHRLQRMINEKECRISLLLKALQHRLKPSVFAEHLVLEQLMGGTFGLLSQSQQTMVSELIKSNRSTSLLIDNIEEFQHPEALLKNYAAEPMNVNHQIRQLVEGEFAAKIREKRQQIDLILDERLSAYPCRIHKLEQVFRNLIHNAVLYTPKYGAIEITTQLISENNWLFSVKDNGPGIPEHILPLLFEPLKNLSVNRLWNGNGLGLYTSREIIQANEGTFEFTSTPEEGTTFRVCLPYK